MDLTTKIKKAGTGLGLLTLLLVPIKAQEKIMAKVGITYITTQIAKVPGCLGIESIAEKHLNKRVSAELEVGWYNNIKDYSKMQANFGFKYKPIVKNGWAAGVKTAIGASSEFYKKPSLYHMLENSETNSINKIIGLDIEKTFKNRGGINFSISKDINSKIWRLGIKRMANQQ